MHNEFSDDHPGVVWPEKQKLPLLFPRWDGETLIHRVMFRLRRAIFGPAFGLPRSSGVVRHKLVWGIRPAASRSPKTNDRCGLHGVWSNEFIRYWK